MIEKHLTSDLAALAFTQNPIAMLILDENATILNINSALEQLTGYNQIDCLGKSISFFDSSHNETSLYDICLQKSVESNDENSLEIYIRCENDTHLLVRKHAKAMIYDGQQYTLCTLEDIMEEKRMLEHYQHLAMHDSLTGLANRTLLKDQFQMAEYRAKRHQQKMALLLCDINGFKAYNDKYGHDFGDEVLQIIAKRLKELLRNNDIVSRYGGDEFVLILEDIAYSDTIAQIVKKIKDTFPITVMHDGQACEISMSIGSACFPADGSDFNQLIQVADKDMYKEKKRFYSAD